MKNENENENTSPASPASPASPIKKGLPSLIEDASTIDKNMAKHYLLAQTSLAAPQAWFLRLAGMKESKNEIERKVKVCQVERSKKKDPKASHKPKGLCKSEGYTRPADWQGHNLKLANAIESMQGFINEFSLGDDKATYGRTFVSMPLAFELEGLSIKKLDDDAQSQTLIANAQTGLDCIFALIAKQLGQTQVRREAKATPKAKKITIFEVGTKILTGLVQGLQGGFDSSKPLEIVTAQRIEDQTIYFCKGTAPNGNNKNGIVILASACKLYEAQSEDVQGEAQSEDVQGELITE